jgi:hypothetical protein
MVFNKFLINVKIHCKRLSIFMLIGRSNRGIEIPVGSVPVVVNNIVPRIVAELPLGLD